MTIEIFITLVLVLIMLVYIAVRIIRDAPDRDELAKFRIEAQDFQKASRELESKAIEIQQLQVDKAKLEMNIKNEQKAAAEKIRLLEESETRLYRPEIDVTSIVG